MKVICYKTATHEEMSIPKSFMAKSATQVCIRDSLIGSMVSPRNVGTGNIKNSFAKTYAN